MAADDDLLKQTTPGTPSPAVERPRNTGSQRALTPDGPVPSSPAPRASNPANPAVRRASNPAMPAAPRTSSPGMPAARTSSPGMPAARTSSPGMPAANRRVSNPAIPRVGTGNNAAHRPAVPDAGAGPTEAGLGAKTDDPTAPGLKPGVRVSGLHKAAVPKKKKGGAGKAVAFAAAVALVFGVGAVWVVLHPSAFPGAGDAASSAMPKRPLKPPMLKAPPREQPGDAPPAEAAKPADEAKPAEVKPAEAKPAEEKPDEIARPEPSNPKTGAHHRAKTVKAEPAAKTVAAAEPETPKEEKPPPSPQQLADKETTIEGLLAKQESARGPDPVVRGFLTQVKAEVAAADTDDKKRLAWAHLNQLQARLSR